MHKKSKNIIGYNMNLNFDNIRSQTFKFVQLTVELLQINYT